MVVTSGQRLVYDASKNGVGGVMRGKGGRWDRGWEQILEVGVLLVGKGRGLGALELLLVLLHERGVDLDLGRGERGRGDKVELGVSARSGRVGRAGEGTGSRRAGGGGGEIGRASCRERVS